MNKVFALLLIGCVLLATACVKTTAPGTSPADTPAAVIPNTPDKVESNLRLGDACSDATTLPDEVQRYVNSDEYQHELQQTWEKAGQLFYGMSPKRDSFSLTDATTWCEPNGDVLYGKGTIVWKQQLLGNMDGQLRQINTWFFWNSGESTSILLLPGTTLAGPALQRDALKIAVMQLKIKVEAPSDAPVRVLNTRPVGQREYSGGIYGIEEEWEWRLGDKHGTCAVGFVPTPDGGTDIIVYAINHIDD